MTTKESISYYDVAVENGLNEDAFEAFCENQHVSSENCTAMINTFVDVFMGDYNSVGDFAEEYCSEAYDFSTIPSIVISAIDWDNVWDSTLRHDFYEIDGFIFRNI
jgi:hypothetical protein